MVFFAYMGNGLTEILQTSTVLEEHDGFSAMPLYPGYTADFFDGKHNIVLGGSWATHSRIAGRKSL